MICDGRAPVFGIQVGDDDALRTIMGHRRVAADMLSVYNRLEVSDERLKTVTNHIHDWLFRCPVIHPAGQQTSDGQANDQLVLAE